MNAHPGVLAQLMATIEDRKANPPPRSYTGSLMKGGVPRIGEKITEESLELVEAAGDATDVPGKNALIHEAADLFYHILVMLAYCDVGLDQVESELASRFGISGLDEKAARDRSPPDDRLDAGE